MLGSLTKPTTCGDNNNRIISAQQPRRCIIQQIRNKMRAENCPISPRLPAPPAWPTYAKKKTRPLSIKLSGRWQISVILSSANARTKNKQKKKRNGSEETQKLPERLRGCFSNSFHLLRHYCCLLLCYISRANGSCSRLQGGNKVGQ